MAKWGEGDPRWIVEERPDATNVNNWHWTEKNATPWSKEKINQLFNAFGIEENEMVCAIDAVESCNGEATVNNRKGKLIIFYEWKVVLKWSGRLTKSEKIHKGKITIPNLSEENDLEEIEITITIDESNSESEILKQFMYNIGRDRVRKQIGLYIKELKEEYSKNLLLPKKVEETNSALIQIQDSKNKLSTNSVATKASDRLDADSSKENSVGCKLDVRTLHMKEDFHCSANDLYNALTKSEMLSAFTRSPVKIEAVRGGSFVLFGGNVQGKFVELIPEKRIMQLWRLRNWPSGHFSKVTIDFEELKNTTQVTLTQTGIPASEYEAMTINWHRYYWHSIKQTFGFGAAISDIL